MFTLDPTRTYLDVAPAAIAALYQSVNQTQVLLPGAPAAMATAVVAGHRVDAGFRVDIGLHLPESNRHIVWRHDGGLLDGEGARDAAREALGFVESMGFFMENVNWKLLDPVGQRELVVQLKVFQPPAAVEVEPKRPQDPRARLARLLAQF